MPSGSGKPAALTSVGKTSSEVRNSSQTEPASLLARVIRRPVVRGRRCDLPVLRISQTEGIGHAVEKRKQCGDIHSLSDLGIGPTGLPQTLGVVGRRAVGVSRNDFDVLHQGTFGIGQRRRVNIAPRQCRDGFVCAPLQLQEVRVRADSVRTMVQARYKRGNHFLGAPREVSVGEMQ